MVASFNADAVVIGGTAAIWVAPSGTTVPTEFDDALDAAFGSVGYTTEDGVKFNDEKTIGAVRAHQSFYPIRRFIENRDATLEFTMLEWDRRTVELAFGGGTWTTPSPGSFKYTPPDPETVDERTMVVDIEDGTTVHRIVVPSGLVVSNTESTFLRTGPSLLPITFGVIGEDASAPWVYLTNSDAAGVGSEGS